MKVDPVAVAVGVPVRDWSPVPVVVNLDFASGLAVVAPVVVRSGERGFKVLALACLIHCQLGRMPSVDSSKCDADVWASLSNLCERRDQV